VSIPVSSNSAVQSREILDLMVLTVMHLRSNDSCGIKHASRNIRKSRNLPGTALTTPTHLVSLRQKVPVSLSKGVIGDLFEDMRILHRATRTLRDGAERRADGLGRAIEGRSEKTSPGGGDADFFGLPRDGGGGQTLVVLHVR
jgi:hypothetical protein